MSGVQYRQMICPAQGNINYIISVRPALNGRLYAKMENGEEILITRKYAKEIAQYFMEEERDERI